MFGRVANYETPHVRTTPTLQYLVAALRADLNLVIPTS